MHKPGTCAALLLTLAGVVSGCGGETEVLVPNQGRLTLTWSVESSQSGSACTAVDADHIEIVVFDAFGRQIDVVDANCEDFVVSIDLPAGTYSVDATLVDSADRSASTTLPIDNLRVTGGTELIVDTDFPLSSII